MPEDFYLNELASVAYFEKDWFDQVMKTGSVRASRFAFAPFDMNELYCPYHERLVEFIGADLSSPPVRVLEVGSATGRTFFEVCRQLGAVEKATLIEPSGRLFDLSARILRGTGEVAHFPVLKGNTEAVEVPLNVAAIREVCKRVEVTALNVSFQEAPKDLGEFDLVICSNVIDQCDDPLELVEFLKRATSPGGTVVISCTYQWQAKYRGLPGRPIKSLEELFPGWWAKNETNIPFRVRINERHWMTFLSHVGVFVRDGRIA